MSMVRSGILVLGIAGLLVMLPGCGTDCSGRAAAGIEIHIARADGSVAPLPDVVRLKKSDEAAFSTVNVDCRPGVETEQICTIWEVTGTYDYEVEVASQTSTGTVRVREDEYGCHPIKEEVHVLLQ